MPEQPQGPAYIPAPSPEATDLAALSGPSFGRPQLSGALPVVAPLLALGLLLVVGAVGVSPGRVPWPVAEPLYAHRNDLAALGVGAIVLALLWLNVTVLF